MNCVFLNGMGKSGNHILYRFRDLIFPDGFLRTLARHHYWKEKICSKNSGKDLCFVIGHYPWSCINEAYLRVRGCRMIFIIRDLRDIVAAYFRASAVKNKTVVPELIAYLGGCDNRDRFIENMILNNSDESDIDPGVLPTPHTFEKYFFPWIQYSDCRVTKFEKLIGSGGGGDDLIQRKEFKLVCEFIGIERSNKWYKENAAKLYHSEVASFVPDGGIGVWKDYFNEKNTELFERVFGKLNRKLGYGL